MNCTAAEKDLKTRFEGIYERGQLPVIKGIEHHVFGSDYGANSWTTRAEADDICQLLELRSGHQLLDVGAGSGWPGLYMAKQSGCDVVLVDLPRAALGMAVDRAVQDQLSDRSWASVADAARLPFGKAVFDAVSHSDILCCLPRKRETLTSCRMVLRPGGRMVFTVVALSPDLSAAETVRAIECGPEFVESTVAYAELLEQTGWKILEYRDLTPEGARLCQQLSKIDQERKEELLDAIGQDDFEERQTVWQSRLDAFDEGLLRREFFVVTPLIS